MYWENAFEILFPPTFITLLLLSYYGIFKKIKKPFQFYFNVFFSFMVIRLFFFSIKSNAAEAEIELKNLLHLVLAL